MAAGRPLNLDQLKNLFDGRMAPEKAEIRKAIETLNEEYEGRGIVVAEVASGFRMQVKASMTERLQKLWEERPPRYSRALFETLALIAYRQPITRGEIEEVRGVSVSSNIVRSLAERDWIRIVGHRDVPGRPEMFGTTKAFLDYFGLKKLDDLPPLADLSDWESLRVQLNLPEVEEEVLPAATGPTDVPVLHAEFPAIDDAHEESAEAGTEVEIKAAEMQEAEEGIPELVPIAEEAGESTEADKLVVSEWPDPAESGG